MQLEPQTIRALVPAVDHPYRSSFVYADVFTPSECATIVRLGLGLQAEDAQVGSSPDQYAEDGATRIARTAWIAPDDAHLWIFDRLADVATRANEIYGFDLIGFTEDIQFTLYDRPGAFYDWHQDGLEGEVAVRKLSMVVQLSDPRDYEGGELELFNVEEDWGDDDRDAWHDAACRQGSVIAFPAFEYHRVCPLLGGRRYSAVAWIGGPPFR